METLNFVLGAAIFAWFVYPLVLFKFWYWCIIPLLTVPFLYKHLSKTACVMYALLTPIGVAFSITLWLLLTAGKAP